VLGESPTPDCHRWFNFSLQAHAAPQIFGRFRKVPPETERPQTLPWHNI
jgi:hypothetical protein